MLKKKINTFAVLVLLLSFLLVSGCGSDKIDGRYVGTFDQNNISKQKQKFEPYAQYKIVKLQSDEYLVFFNRIVNYSLLPVKGETDKVKAVPQYQSFMTVGRLDGNRLILGGDYSWQGNGKSIEGPAKGLVFDLKEHTLTVLADDKHGEQVYKLDVVGKLTADIMKKAKTEVEEKFENQLLGKTLSEVDFSYFFAEKPEGKKKMSTIPESVLSGKWVVKNIKGNQRNESISVYSFIKGEQGNLYVTREDVMVGQDNNEGYWSKHAVVYVGKLQRRIFRVKLDSDKMMLTSALPNVNNSGQVYLYDEKKHVFYRRRFDGSVIEDSVMHKDDDGSLSKKYEKEAVEDVSQYIRKNMRWVEEITVKHLNGYMKEGI